MTDARRARPFRIERERGAAAPPTESKLRPADGDSLAALRHSIEALTEEVRALKADASGAPAAPVQPPPIDPDIYKKQILEAEQLKSDLQELQDAIERTKQEIASLRAADKDADKIASAGEALRAVVGDTETATNGIINAAEGIEELAGRLRAQVSGDEAAGMVDELYEHVTGIFEHCNFQDITGQRITKVVSTMEFIDERVHRMMEIWGGDQAFKDVAVETAASAETGQAGETLHGPAIEGDASISQAEIDALFD
jgi:chemotaxis protein CheZ